MLPRARFVWIIAGALVVALSTGAFVMLRSGGAATPAAVPFSDFLNDVTANRIAPVNIEGDMITYERRDRQRFETVAPRGYVAANPTLVTGLIARGVRFHVTRTEPPAAWGYGTLGVA